MAAFARWVEESRGLSLSGFTSLHEWSISDLDGFWGAVWEHFDIVASAQGECALRAHTMPGAEWFPGARLNYAENTLRWARTSPHELAVIGEHETRERLEWTWSDLEARVASLAQRLRDLGVVRGDRVAGVLPNIPETVVALLATASVGAVWSVVNTDFGPAGGRPVCPD